MAQNESIAEELSFENIGLILVTQTQKLETHYMARSITLGLKNLLV